MTKLRIAIVGYGNTGRAALDAVLAAPDMEAAGVVLRDKAAARQKGVPEFLTSAEDIAALGKVDVAILGTPTRDMPAQAAKLLAVGINTVDSYDFHPDIYDRKIELDAIAKANNSVAVIAAGWDPGTDSVVRALLEAAAPKGITDTNFGPGMSMGHTVAVKSIPGVADALSITEPNGSGLHRRMVYIQLDDPNMFDEVSEKIKNDPYFVKDETHVKQVEDIRSLTDKGSAVNIRRKGVSGAADNQIFSFNMSINNPALTGQVLVSSARASARQKSGCYTLIEIPVVDFLPGDREKIIRRLV